MGMRNISSKIRKQSIPKCLKVLSAYDDHVLAQPYYKQKFFI